MGRTMKCARLHGIGDIRVESAEVAAPAAGEVLVKVHACSVCGSDVRIFNSGNDRVKYPAIIGHEIAGEVVEVGPGVERLRPGRRVALGADVPSMADEWSKRGLANLCDINYAIGYQFPGGFAQYCLLNELTVRFGPVATIPEHVSYDSATLAEPLACCINGLERAAMAPGKTVLIIGAGPVGMLLARSAEAFGASLVALVDRSEHRIRLARELGLGNVFDGREVTLKQIDEQVAKEREGFDVILTACSSPEAQEQAVEVVAKRGVVNFFGGLAGDARDISLHSNTLHYREASATGSHGSTPTQHTLAVSMIASGRIQVDSLITHRFGLERIAEAFETVQTQKGLKVVVRPWDSNGR